MRDTRRLRANGHLELPKPSAQWWGYTTYPTATLTSANLTTMNASPFIATEATSPATSGDCSEL